MYLVLVNGPPRSGKDTVARILYEIYSPKMPTKIIKLADPILQCVFSIFPNVNEDNYEELKSNKTPVAEGNLTVRDVMIKLAEDFIKPTLGKNAFVDIAINRINNIRALLPNGGDNSMIIISDLGFDEEYDKFLQYCADESSNIKMILIKVYKNGCTFDEDSRKYIDVPDKKNVTELRLHNDGTIEELKNKIIKRFDPYH